MVPMPISFPVSRGNSRSCRTHDYDLRSLQGGSPSARRVRRSAIGCTHAAGSRNRSYARHLRFWLRKRVSNTICLWPIASYWQLHASLEQPFGLRTPTSRKSTVSSISQRRMDNPNPEKQGTAYGVYAVSVTRAMPDQPEGNDRTRHRAISYRSGAALVFQNLHDCADIQVTPLFVYPGAVQVKQRLSNRHRRANFICSIDKKLQVFCSVF